MWRVPLLLCAWAVCQCQCAKVLLMVPTLSRSNALFNGRVAGLLVDAGHDVHLLAPNYDPTVDMAQFAPAKATVHKLYAFDPVEYEVVKKGFADQMFLDQSLLEPAAREGFQNFSRLLSAGCQAVADAAKVLFMVPGVSASNVIFESRVAALLQSAGHDVHLYAPVYDPELDVSQFAPPNVTVHRLPAADPDVWREHKIDQRQFTFHDVSRLDGRMRKHFQHIFGMLADACEAQVTNKEVMARLKAEKFDLAFAHMYDMCPFGIIHMLGIPSTIWMSSSVLVEHMALLAGVPTPSSFVPTTMSDFSDHMTFWQRMQNFLGLTIFAPFFLNLYNGQTEIFRRHVDPNFPELNTLASEKSQLLFVNSIDLLDFPRPVLHKVVYIGGIGMRDPKPLEDKWERVMSAADAGVVLVSFGSVAPSNSMPLHWKQAIVGLAAAQPKYTFIWKYETPDDLEAQVGKLPTNLQLSPWVPQTDLLGHAKLKAFITHGGYNSLLESAMAGKPILAVPLFGDQYRNARVSEKHGYGKMVLKKDMSAATLSSGINTLLTDKSYVSNARTLSHMLRKRPIKSEQLVVAWTEFLAEFGQLPNLDAASRTMSTVAYNNIDVIGVLLAAAALLLFVLYKLVRFVLCCCFGRAASKQKRE